MSTSLPVLTRTIDDAFTDTWYEVRADAMDNILTSNVLLMALKEKGCIVSQDGGDYVNRTVRYGTKSVQRFQRGSVLNQFPTKKDTTASWEWKQYLADCNRSMVDDAKNAGKYKIQDYVSKEIEAARNALSADMDTMLFQWTGYYDPSTPAQPNGLYDICPNYTAEVAVGAGAASDSQAVGTSNGGINRATNSWWRNWVAYDSATQANSTFIAGACTAPHTLNLVPDMRHVWNCVNAAQEAPNFIMTDQAMYEVCQSELADKQQIVMNSIAMKAIDLGFPAFTFNGATCTWSPKMPSATTVHHMFMLNLNYVEMVYNSNIWFDMTEWMYTANQLERVAYIACMTTGLITDQPRRHGVMEYAS